MSEEGAKVEIEEGRERKHLKHRPEEKEFRGHPETAYTAALIFQLGLSHYE